jgi:hypothetical protein
VSENDKKRWYEDLTEEDLAFIKRLVLASGSLKELAKAYDVSYPTIRLRLDRLIAKVQVLDEQRDASEFERRLALLYAEGKIDMDVLNALLAAHRQEKETDQ